MDHNVVDPVVDPGGHLPTTSASPHSNFSDVTLDRYHIPSLLLTNANRIFNKLDELSILLETKMFDIVAITETWLSDDIPDSVVHVNEYSVFRQDRHGAIGGGVMCYISKNIFSRVLDLETRNDLNFEILWLLVRPMLLSRPLSIVIVAVLYCPPWYNADLCSKLSRYLVSCVDELYRKYNHPCFLLVGDFNSLDCNLFNKYLHFKQLVINPTRGENILDKIFTNKSDFFDIPVTLPPLGRSDHVCIHLKPQHRLTSLGTITPVRCRNLCDSVIDQIGFDLVHVRWVDMFRLDNVQSQADFFYSTVLSIVDKYAPINDFAYKTSDKPWITQKFKVLIKERNAAFTRGDDVSYRRLRNQVNRLRITLQNKYYNKHIEILKKNDPRKWWRSIKNICGIDTVDRSFFDHMTFQGNTVTPSDLPDVINNFLFNISESIPPVDGKILSDLRSSLVESPPSFVVSEYAVYRALSRIKTSSVPGPDLLSSRLLSHLSDIFAAPLCSIINMSIRQGIVPWQWKLSRVTPVPKCNPVQRLEDDIRPISITPCLAKIAESFMSSYFNDHFNDFIDDNQFGSTKGRSTTLALIKFSHDLFAASDNSANIIRVLFIDFSKAFDLIDHNKLMHKMIQNNFPPHITAWSISFLENRNQFVRIGNTVSSAIGLNAGCPQGTLSGPNNFKLFINDLTFSLPYIKYVDDTTVASVSNDPDDPALQQALDDLCSWCGVNSMKINVNKTKEMVIYFGRRFQLSNIPMLNAINDASVARVDCFKLLGVYFSADLNWKHHVDFMLNKVAKRIYYIYLLTRAGVNSNHVVEVYCSIIRSVLEYASPVWHPGLTKTQSKSIECIQKRCLRVIFPDLNYKEALFVSGLLKLSERREICVRDLFNQIKRPDHTLHYLLTPKISLATAEINKDKLRSCYPFEIPRAKTSRLNKSFIAYCLINRF